MLEIGAQIDRYRVESVLGEGGMAVVYRVRHIELDTEYALKVLTIEASGARRRLLAEGRVQAELDHPNAITVTDVIDVDGAPGLVMEYIRGGSLDEWIDTDPPREQRLRVFRQICEAVAQAHANGWVHRDLKPANVLMKETADGLIPKVGDFGIVKLSEAAAGKTRHGSMMGTPGYMAPEQIEDASQVDARADVFSLGCLLHEILSGEPAFAGPSQLDLITQVAEGKHRRLPADEQLAPVVARCLQRDPDKRPADAAALIEAVETAPPLRPSRPAWLLLLPVAGLAAAGGALVVAVGLVLTFAVGSPGAGTDCELKPGRIGYVRIDETTSAPLDVQITLDRPLGVLPNPRREDRTCTLPAGTVITTREVVRKGWVAVFGESVTLP